MNIKNYIDSLFSDYEETPAVIDFKEELQSNLEDRIKSYVKRGMKEESAFDKAKAELGDISALADEISLKKRQEVFQNMYMQTRHYMSSWRIALYVLCGSIMGFGIIIALLTGLHSHEIVALLGSMIPFCILPVAGLVFLGLTQETAAKEAMSWKRALLYVITVSVFLFGLIVFAITFFAQGAGLPEAIATLIPFVLPSVAFGVFLVLTEKDRSKPWIIAQRNEMFRHENERFADPVFAKRYGLVCGALWILALAAFILLTITIGFKYSWLAFVGGIVGQLVIEFVFTKREYR